MAHQRRHADACRPDLTGAAHHATGGATIPILRRRPGARRRGASGGYRLLLKDSVIYGTGRAVQKLLMALLLPLYTAYLTPADYGILGMVVTVTTFLDVFVTLGFDVAFSRFYFDDTSPEGRRKVVTNVFYVSTVYPAIVIGTCAVIMPQLAPWLLGEEYSAGDWKYFVVALVTLFFTNLNDLPFHLLRLEHKPWRFSAYIFARIAVQVPLSVLFVAVFDWGPMGVLGANLFTAVGLHLALLPVYVRRLNRLPDPKVLRPMTAFAVPALFTGVSFYWLKISDRFFLLHYQGKAEVGLYTVANSLAQPVYLVLMAFRMAWPQWHYSKLGDPETHKRIVARSSTYFLALNGFMLVVLGALLPLLAHLLLNERFWSVVPTTFVLALSIAIYGAYFIFWVGSNVAKKNQMVPVFFAISSAVNVGLNFLFVPAYGMWAAAWNTVIGYAILAVTIYFYSRRYYPIPYEWPRLLKLIGATALALAAVFGVMQLIGLETSLPLSDLVWRTAAALPAVAVFPLALVVSGFFNPGEREKLLGPVRRLRKGGRGETAPPEHESEEEASEALETEARLDVTEKGGLNP
ncbi:MAG TPA: oligosaccharide flippase family protein [Thermoleophilia bacterium]|nr:oligosaccharide flippase family protein [Thermoleophilia bacterium]